MSRFYSPSPCCQGVSFDRGFIAGIGARPGGNAAAGDQPCAHQGLRSTARLSLANAQRISVTRDDHSAPVPSSESVARKPPSHRMTAPVDLLGSVAGGQRTSLVIQGSALVGIALEFESFSARIVLLLNRWSKEGNPAVCRPGLLGIGHAFTGAKGEEIIDRGGAIQLKLIGNTLKARRVNTAGSDSDTLYIRGPGPDGRGQSGRT